MGVTRDEFKNIVKGLKSIYTGDNFIATKEAFDLWYSLLSDIDYPLLSVGVTRYMMSETRYPTPADIRKACTSDEERTDGEAWGIVLKAIQKSTYGSTEAFQALPRDIQQAVGSPEVLRAWATPENASLEVIQSQFLRSYRAKAEMNAKALLIAPAVAERIKALTQAAVLALEGGTE